MKHPLGKLETEGAQAILERSLNRVVLDSSLPIMSALGVHLTTSHGYEPMEAVDYLNNMMATALRRLADSLDEGVLSLHKDLKDVEDKISAILEQIKES